MFEYKNRTIINYSIYERLELYSLLPFDKDIKALGKN